MARPLSVRRRAVSSTNLKALTGCLLGAFCSPLTLMISALAIAMPALSRAFGWSRAEISGALSVMLFLSALMTAVWGRIIDRRGVAKLIAGGTLGVGVAMLALAMTPASLTWFYLCFAALAVAGSTGVGYNKVIAALFARNRGKALAVFGMEATLVGVLIPPLLFALMRFYGWRGMFCGSGLIVLAVAPTLLLLLPRSGRPAGADSVGAGRAMPTDGLTGPQTRRTREFWLINGATMFGNLTATGLLPHVVALTLSHGLSAGVAVAALSLQTTSTALGQVAGGFVLDRIDTPRVAIPFALLALLGLAMIAFARPEFGGSPLLLSGAGLLGFGNGAKRSMNTYFQTRFFGLRALAENSGWSIAVTSFVLAPAPFLFGIIFDRTRSYDGALAMVAAGLVAALVFYFLLRPYRYPVVPNAGSDVSDATVRKSAA